MRLERMSAEEKLSAGDKGEESQEKGRVTQTDEPRGPRDPPPRGPEGSELGAFPVVGRPSAPHTLPSEPPSSLAGDESETRRGSLLICRGRSQDPKPETLLDPGLDLAALRLRG